MPLKSLLSEAQSRCLDSLQSRENNNMDEDKLQEAARIMGISAIKYADLHNNRTTNYTFSYDRMLDLKGNTAVYLLYTHARISSILDALVTKLSLLLTRAIWCSRMRRRGDWRLPS